MYLLLNRFALEVLLKLNELLTCTYHSKLTLADKKKPTQYLITTTQMF